jgi:hypothetical protein
MVSIIKRARQTLICDRENPRIRYSFRINIML